MTIVPLLKLRRDQFARALERLREASLGARTSLEQDGCIQRFEFTFELAWKAVAAALSEEGVDAPSPRHALQEARRLGWIEDDPQYLTLIEDRNLTSHTYHEATAAAVLSRMPVHIKLFERLLAALERGA